ncbi:MULTISPECIES: hypothetical protein [Corynebacterium]|uniref:hypothetical protein n=1 Tax=Corynebacterium TaxID=1716 RepID=UPI00124E4B66|nr:MULTISPECIES: hypothetical protein [Corynebacterium]
MSELIGCRAPRLSSIPDGDTSRGDKAVAFARWAGMTLFPWQEDVLRAMCATDDEGLWAASESVIVVPRQNGKGEILVARELAGIYLFGESEILHTAHFLDTAVDARDRLWEVIEGNEDLFYWWEDDPDHPGVPTLVRTNGKEGIIFPNDAKARFRTRTDKTGRGLSIDLLVLDECFNLPTQVYAAMSKTTRAKQNAHTVFISSPVNREEHYHGGTFSAKRWGGIDGVPGTLFMEWSADPEQVDVYSDAALIQANPSLTRSGPGAQYRDARKDAESARVSEELRDAYLVETLGIGNWVPRDGDDSDFQPIIDVDQWTGLADSEPVVTRLRESALGVDVNVSGDVCATVAAVKTRDGVHLSLADRVEFDRDGLVADIGTAVELNDPLAVAIDVRGPASTIERGIRDLGVEPMIMQARDVAKAYMLMQQLVQEGGLSHDGDPRWLDALSVVEEREIGEYGRAVKRVRGAGSPIVAATFAILALERNALQEVVPMRRPTVRPKLVPMGAPVGRMKF